jgi:hypothetical protein
MVFLGSIEASNNNIYCTDQAIYDRFNMENIVIVENDFTLSFLENDMKIHMKPKFKKVSWSLIIEKSKCSTINALIFDKDTDDKYIEDMLMIRVKHFTNEKIDL